MRLILNSIVLHNFKSYKGTHTIKDIDKSFTAIVGPNGSGKSNVIDSILFVLGFRAKKMRHQQVTDLIYSDGQRETEAFVELIFNKFRVKRSVNLNKSTKYFLDGLETTSSNIIKIMMEEGVDMEHNRFLILQGEIESIAMMKPKEGLLEFLENIIGTSSYKKEIEDEQNEIKNLEQLKTDAQTSLNFIKKDYDHAEILKNQNEKAVKEKINFLIKNNELFNMKNILINQKKIEAEENKNLISNEIEILRSKNEETKKIFETYENKFSNKKKLLNEKEGAFLNAKRDFKKAERQNEIQKEIKNKLEKKIKNLEKEIKQNEIKENYSKELKENEEELRILNKKIEKNKEKLLKTKKKGEYALLKAEEEKLIKLIDKKSEITKKNAEIKIKEEEKNKIKEEKSKLEIKIIKIESGDFNGDDGNLDDGVNCKEDGNLNAGNKLGNKNMNGPNMNTVNKNAVIKNSVNKIGDKTKNGVTKLDDKNAVNNLGVNFNSYKDLLKSKLIEINKDILITQKELNKRKRRQDEVIQMKEIDLKEQEIILNLKGIKGVLGRLKDLGEINSKYEIALKSSCNRMNNIVVDTVLNADKVMEIIKKKNIPRTTLIVLEKIKEIPPLEEQPIPYLFKLINCEEKFKKIFYFALTDTLICENLKEAEKYAFNKKRKRVVTLDGKLIEKSGVMTGGKVIERIKSYEELEKSLLKMEKIKKENEEKLEEIKKLREYKEKVKEMEKEINKIENEIRGIRECKDKGGSEGSSDKGKGSSEDKGDIEDKVDIKDKGKGSKSPLTNTPSETNNPLHSNLHFLNSQIDLTKSSILLLKNKLENSLDSDLREVQIDLKIQNEKIEIIEKRNQDIKILISDLPIQNENKENQLLLAKNEIKKIKINEIEGNLKKKFKDLEEEYNLILISFKESQEEMNNLKKKMGDNYHNEINLKNKYEDLEEKIGEYEEEKGKIEEKIKKIKKEIKELRKMICENENEGGDDDNEDKDIDDDDDDKGGDLGKGGDIDNEDGDEGVDSVKRVIKSKGKLTHKTNNTPLTNNTNINNPLTNNPKDLLIQIKNHESLLSQYSLKEILPGVFEEFNLLKSSLEKSQNDFNLISDSYKSKRNKIENLKSKRYEEFMEGFKSISKNLKEIYKTLTYGGNAELELVDYLDPFSEGVVLAVMPPKKCWKNINNLSGGEKTLSSLSLIFALHKYKPSPFYVMDEIDAALDYRNVSIISNYIKEMTRNSQFIVISLRSDMFEMSKSILGIYKTRNISKFLMIKVDKMMKM